MLKHYLRAAALLAAVTVAGCKRGGPPPLPPGVAPEDTSTRLNTMSDVVVGHWLKMPRPELAKLVDEWSETVERQRSAIEKNPSSVDLLPKVLPPLVVPVFHEAKFSPSAGFSLPPYALPGKPDAGVALHLARYGDCEAAAKYGPPELFDKIAVLKTEQNYPVEWTRLVGLVLISGELKLSTGDPDGAMLISAVHKQLTELLDKKAAAGPLGAALLSMGKNAIEQAGPARREKKRNKVGLAEDVEAAFKAWGDVPAATPALPFGAPAADVQALFGTAPRGRAVFAETPERIARVADLLGLPIPTDGARAVVAFLDADGKLAEWQVAYRPKIDTLYRSPAQLAFRLAEAGFTAAKETRTNNLSQQSFTGGDAVVEVTRSNRSPALGGFVRVTPAKPGAAGTTTHNLRDFGPVHLDRTFETNRLALHAATGGTLVTVKDSQAMKKMAKVLDTPTPDLVLLLRDKEQDVVNLLEMSWPPGEIAHALEKLLPSLWDDYGPAKLEDVEDQAGGYLSFTWEDKKTRVRLRLAFDERGPVLSARDLQGGKGRADQARKVDLKERAARLADGKGDDRLSRSPGRVNEISLAGLKLGQPKAEAEKALPKGKQYRRKDLPAGVSFTILTPPDKAMPYWAKQLQVRYDAGRVSEIRLRYQRGPAVVKKGEPLLQSLTDASGAPETLPAAWAGLWTDIPGAGKPVCYRWRDDRTIRTYERDDGGMEVSLIDRAPEMVSLEPPPWRFVSDGVPHCQLGDTREVVESYFKSPAMQSEGGDVYRAAASSPYEMIVVWYQGDRVARLLAIHRQRSGVTAKEVTAALSAAWGKDIDLLGAIRRQQGESGQVLGAHWWHDDHVRVRHSVQTTDQGPRLMTEWRYYPFANDSTKREG